VDFVLAHHHRLGPEALDDGAHEGRTCGLVSSTGTSFLAPASSKRFAHRLDELLQLRRRHGELAFLALADDGFRKGLFPVGRQRQQRQIAARRQIGVAELAGQAGAHMLGDVKRVLGVADRFGDAFQDGGQVADRDALDSRVCSTRCTPVTEICDGMSSSTSFLCSGGRSSSSFLVSA
jgi:hypothetical protein